MRFIEHTYEQTAGRRRTAGDHCDFQYADGDYCGEPEGQHVIEEPWDLMARFSEGDLSFEGRVALLENWHRAILGQFWQHGERRNWPAWLQLRTDRILRGESEAIIRPAEPAPPSAPAVDTAYLAAVVEDVKAGKLGRQPGDEAPEPRRGAIPLPVRPCRDEWDRGISVDVVDSVMTWGRGWAGEGGAIARHPSCRRAIVAVAATARASTRTRH